MKPGKLDGQADGIDRELRRAYRRLYTIWAACMTITIVTLGALITLS